MAGTGPLPWRRLLWRRLRILAVLLALALVAASGVYLFAPQWLVDGWQAQQAREAGLRQHHSRIHGQDWHWYEAGQGPTLVLLHGAGGSAQDWVPVAPYLSGNFHLLIPDLPGWGDSALPDGAAGPRAQAARLASFLAAQAPANSMLVGHGSGGLIAGLYAASHPDQVAALGFVDSAGLGHWSTAAQAQPFAYTDAEGLRRLRSLTLSDPARLPGRIAKAMAEANRSRIAWVRQTFQALHEPATSQALQEVLPTLAKPVLVLWCHDDPLIERTAVDAFRRQLKASPRIDVSTLFGCAHLPMRDKPAATAQIITRFVLPG